jgi:GTP-binding protein
MPGIIAIVGRPNVGKSALFNRIVGRRVAIVHDQPGVTRDRVSMETEWKGRPFTLIDTGGIGLMTGEKATDIITEAAINQVELAIEAADVVILTVSVQEGLAQLDLEIAARLRRSSKPVILAVNKVDTPGAEPGMDEFAQLGLDVILPVSAAHDRGMSELIKCAVNRLPAWDPEWEIQDANSKEPKVPPLKLAIVGRPNVGKSSLINALIGSDRVIVSDIPGTTRDAVDVPFEIQTDERRERYVLIDTAGVRKRRSVDDSVEFFSIKRTENAISRCDIAVMVLDASAGVTKQDMKIAGEIVEAKKACVLIVNKWDKFRHELKEVTEEILEVRRQDKREGKDLKRREDQIPDTRLSVFGGWIQEKLFFLSYAPVIFTSATEKYQLDRFLESVRFVSAQLQQSVPTSLLNRTIADAIEIRQPVSATGKRLKFFYATQVSKRPPSFLLFVNRGELFSDNYTKFLENCLRKAFGFEGCPIRLIPRERPRSVAPVRRATPARGKKTQESSGQSKNSVQREAASAGRGRSKKAPKKQNAAGRAARADKHRKKP